MGVVDQISADLLLSGRYVRLLVREADFMYKRYYIKKRSGGLREINHPARPLKVLQRWLEEGTVELTSVVGNERRRATSICRPSGPL